MDFGAPCRGRVICHAVLRDYASVIELEKNSGAPPEVLTGDLKFYSPDGYQIGGLQGFTVKRATQTALLSAHTKRDDLLYEVVWRNKTLSSNRSAQGVLTDPVILATQVQPLVDHLAEEGVEISDRIAFMNDVERLSGVYVLQALERMGWMREAGATIRADGLHHHLKVIEEHRSLLRTHFEHFV